jgi:hypothetical protein
MKLVSKQHQWELLDPENKAGTQRCVVCYKQKPVELENTNECPGYPDLFLHFKEDATLIRRPR